MTGDVCFGIDLGTTNSCISMLMQNTSVPKIIPLKDGMTIPSCVMLKEDGSIVVGKEAYEKRFEECTIYSVKRYMGQDIKITLKAGDLTKEYSPEEISSFILKAIVEQAEDYVGKGIIKDVTITVPAHFNDAQRRATKRAGELAGLNVINIINEPTSAGLLYGLDNAKNNQTILVYDLGGGTFDVSILRITKELRKFPLLGINMGGEYNKTAINIIGNDGDVHLGGDDIDQATLDYVLQEAASLKNLNVEVLKSVMGDAGLEELKLSLEKSKKKDNKFAYFSVDGFGDFKIPIHNDKHITACYEPVFNRSYELVAKAMASAGVTSIDHIVLVGGSTKSKYIQSLLKGKFKHLDVMNTFEPDLSVGLGASISSSSALGISKIATITDVVPMSVGIRTIDENDRPFFEKMLKKDSQLPCTAFERFDVIDTNEPIILRVYQGESKTNFDDLLEIGTLCIEPDKYTGDTIDVMFKCDLNGVLSCSVVIDGKEVPIDIKYTANMTAVSKESDSTVELSRGESVYYKGHRNKLVKAGASEDVLSRWTPEVVKQGMGVANEIFNNLMREVDAS